MSVNQMALAAPGNSLVASDDDGSLPDLIPGPSIFGKPRTTSILDLPPEVRYKIYQLLLADTPAPKDPKPLVRSYRLFTKWPKTKQWILTTTRTPGYWTKGIRGVAFAHPHLLRECVMLNLIVPEYRLNVFKHDVEMQPPDHFITPPFKRVFHLKRLELTMDWSAGCGLFFTRLMDSINNAAALGYFHLELRFVSAGYGWSVPAEDPDLALMKQTWMCLTCLCHITLSSDNDPALLAVLAHLTSRENSRFRKLGGTRRVLTGGSRKVWNGFTKGHFLL